MPISKPQSTLGAAAVLSLSATVAVAQQQDQAPPPATGKPPVTAPAPGPQTSPAPPRQKPKAAQPSQVQAGHDLVGLSVFSSDGTRVGDVRSVSTAASGNVVALHIKTGGFLGFGGRIVAIPGGAFAKKGPDIRLNLSAEEVDNLPDVKEAQ